MTDTALIQARKNLVSAIETCTLDASCHLDVFDDTHPGIESITPGESRKSTPLCPSCDSYCYGDCAANPY